MSSYRVAQGVVAQGTLDAVSDTVELVCDGAPGVVAWIESVNAVSGLKIVFEGQLNGSAWNVIHFHASNTTNKTTPIIESATLAALPGYFWSIPSQGVYRIRARCSALVGGSAVLKLKCVEFPVE